MESYLMMLYVTLEQESALKNFFVKQGWEFSKPDLTVTTNRLGPSVPDAQTVKKSLSSGTSPTVVGKRKAKMKLKAPVVKMAKVISSKSHISSKSELNNEPSISDVQLDTENKDTKSRSRVDKKRECKSSVNLNKLTVKEENLDQSEIAEISNDDGDGDTDLDCNFEESAEGSDIKTDEFKMENSLTNESENDTEDAEVEAGVNNTKTVKKEIGETKIARCNKCSKVFACKGNLKKHLVRHGEKRIACTICNKRFFRQDELQQHVSYVHDKNKTIEHICEVCGNMYRNKSALQNHFTCKHLLICKEECRCTICGKMLSSKRKRMLHERTHLKRSEAVKCKVCKKHYKDEEKHIAKCTRSLQHHDQESSEDEKIFSEEKKLNEHFSSENAHAEYLCPVCNNTFKEVKAFVAHKENCFTTEVHVVYLDQ